MKLKYVIHEIRRVLYQYRMAIVTEAGDRARNRLKSAYRIFTARFRYGVGPVFYSLYQFSRVPVSTWGNYITDDPKFKQLLMGLNPEEPRTIVNNKLLFHRHCATNGVPTIPIICVVTNDPDLPTCGVERVSTLERWRATMGNAPNELFIKTIDGTFGEGAFAVERTGDKYAFSDRVGTIDDVYRYLCNNLDGERGWLVQRRARSSGALAGIVSPHGLATVRLVTQMRNGKAEPVIAELKITVGTSVIDNFSKGRSGNLLASIDIESGALSAAWGSIRKDWPVIRSFSHHPETGGRIEGFVLPFWKELVELALKAQESLPMLRSLGWDIAATTDGLVVVEGNATYGVSSLQVAHQRGLKREIATLLGLPMDSAATPSREG